MLHSPPSMGNYKEGAHTGDTKASLLGGISTWCLGQQASGAYYVPVAGNIRLLGGCKALKT